MSSCRGAEIYFLRCTATPQGHWPMFSGPQDLARPVPNLCIYPGEVRRSCKESGWLKGFRVSRRALRRKAVAKPVPMTHVREPRAILSTGSTSTRPTRNKAGKDARNAREHREHDLGWVGVARGRPDRDVK